MIDKKEYQRLLGKLVGIQMGSGFNHEAPADAYLKDLHKHFNEREILILKEGNAIPMNYKTSDYKAG